jgi:hypothetical protein
MTSPPPAGDSLDNPIFWHEFLKRLSFCDIEYDVEIIRSLCEAIRISPQRVLAKMKAHMHYGDASTAAH